MHVTCLSVHVYVHVLDLSLQSEGAAQGEEVTEEAAGRLGWTWWALVRALVFTASELGAIGEFSAEQ